MNSSLPKFHPKHLAWLMPLILSGMMSCALSFINLAHSRGFSEGFLGTWLDAWGMSWLIAYPMILIFLPLVRKILMKFVAVPNE